MRSRASQGQDAQAVWRGWGGGRNLRGQRRRKGSKEAGQGSQKRSWRLTDSSAVMEGRQAGEKAPEIGGEGPSLREGNQHKG